MFSTPCFATTYSYDALNRLTHVGYDNGNSVDYSYDAGGNITRVDKTVNGVCGSSNGATLSAPPTANLCSSGTASGSGLWNWDCTGTGNTASCAATIQTYAVSFTSSGNGTVTGTTSQTVSHSANATTVTANPATGYHFVNWTEGATVVGTTAGLTIPNITATHAYIAIFAANPAVVPIVPIVAVNGVCGISHGASFISAPTENFCNVGSATIVSVSAPWSWNCSGSNGGTTAICTANIDITGPTLTLSTLVNNAITNNNILNISGTVSDANGVAGLKINNTDITVTNGTFSHALTLNAGTNTITTIATDTVGNNNTDSRIVTMDIIAPTLTISEPADNSYTNKTVVNVSGVVGESATVNITVPENGINQVAAMDGTSFGSSVNLANGLNTITVTATDLAGNNSQLKRTVTSDTQTPVLAITNPLQDVTTTEAAYTINGTVSDSTTQLVTLSLVCDGTTLTPSILNGAFSQQLLFTTAKQYAVVATATDSAGNSATVQRNIIYVPNAPAITGDTKGDINGDGKVDISDALLALQIAVGLATPSAAELATGDVAPLVNGKPQPDGVIDVGDAFLLLRKTVGLVTW